MYIFENSKSPLYKQLYIQIKKDIEDGKIKAKDKLPSIRALSNEYNLSKNTIQTTYDQLYAEGYIESIPQKGYFVIEDLYKKYKKEKTYKENKKEQIEYKYDFFPAQLEKDSFPIKTWLKLHTKVLKNEINFSTYHDPQGLGELRIQIAEYLNTSRALKCDENQIVLTSGFSDAMMISSILLKKHTKKIALEQNAYRVSKKVFEQMGFSLEYIMNLNNQIDIKQLNKSEAKLLLLTPAHQYLMGQTIPINLRMKILEWAKQNNSYIIEDDYDSELSYYNSPIPALQGIDTEDRVIYFGTFSKSFSPALRVAYLVLPHSLISKYKESFDYHFSGLSIDIQKTLSLFMREGYFNKHIRKIRTQNKRKHDFTKEYLETKLKSKIEIKREGSGLSLLFEVKTKISWEFLKSEARNRKINLYIREDFYKKTYISLGFGGFKLENLPKALDEFIKLFNDSTK
jgi:GntR family transcriptional regulator/MocR family aminotransferase